MIFGKCPAPKSPTLRRGVVNPPERSAGVWRRKRWGAPTPAPASQPALPWPGLRPAAEWSSVLATVLCKPIANGLFFSSCFCFLKPYVVNVGATGKWPAFFPSHRNGSISAGRCLRNFDSKPPLGGPANQQPVSRQQPFSNPGPPSPHHQRVSFISSHPKGGWTVTDFPFFPPVTPMEGEGESASSLFPAAPNFPAS